MSNNKQTAVEWLVEKLDQNFDYVADTIIEQAKEMEKQQIIDAFGNVSLTGEYDYVMLIRKKAEQYYNEQYGK